MTGAELEREYLVALRETRAQDLAPLTAAGVPGQAIAMAMPAIARVRVERDFYTPDPEGGLAYLLPVRVADPISPEAIDPDETIAAGDVVDLLAFHPKNEGRWALRAGAAEWAGAIKPLYMAPEAVRISRSPLSWLRAGCEGLVLLSRDRRDQYRILTGCLGGILAEDLRHAAELRRVLEHPWPAPRVIVAEARHAA